MLNNNNNTFKVDVTHESVFFRIGGYQNYVPASKNLFLLSKTN